MPQRVRTEREWQELAQRGRGAEALGPAEVNAGVGSGELGELLAAAAARRAGGH